MEDLDRLTTRQACERLGMAPRDLYRLIDIGGLPAYRHGDDLYLLPADVAAFQAR